MLNFIGSTIFSSKWQWRFPIQPAWEFLNCIVFFARVSFFACKGFFFACNSRRLIFPFRLKSLTFVARTYTLRRFMHSSLPIRSHGRLLNSPSLLLLAGPSRPRPWAPHEQAHRGEVCGWFEFPLKAIGFLQVPNFLVEFFGETVTGEIVQAVFISINNRWHKFAYPWRKFPIDGESMRKSSFQSETRRKYCGHLVFIG